MKEEALELADFLEKNMVASIAILGDVTAEHIITTIRRLVEELDKQFKNGFEAGKLEGWKAHKYHSTPQTKPLSDEELLAIADKFIERFEYEPCNVDEIGFARAIEERHGIK